MKVTTQGRRHRSPFRAGGRVRRCRGRRKPRREPLGGAGDIRRRPAVVPSPRLTTASSRTHLLAPPLLLAAFMLAGVVTLAPAGGWVARADAQPTLTVTVKSGTATQTIYTVVAANFPAHTAITETIGDGSLIAPVTGQTNASGSLTVY